MAICGSSVAFSVAVVWMCQCWFWWFWGTKRDAHSMLFSDMLYIQHGVHTVVVQYFGTSCNKSRPSIVHTGSQRCGLLEWSPLALPPSLRPQLVLLGFALAHFPQFYPSHSRCRTDCTHNDTAELYSYSTVSKVITIRAVQCCTNTPASLHVPAVCAMDQG